MLTRWAVFVHEGDNEWRFNADFGGKDACVRAHEEADWYISTCDYQVAVVPVPDDTRKYTWHMFFTTDMKAVVDELGRVVDRNTALRKENEALRKLRDVAVGHKSRLIMEGRERLAAKQPKQGAALLLEAAAIEDILAETAGTNPGGPQRKDHLVSADSCRALAARASGDVHVCRNFDAWGCNRDENDNAVDPRSCRVCGGTKEQHQ